MTTTKPKVIRCSKCTKHLSAFLDGELPGALAEAVRAHVTGCPACADRLERLRALHGALDQLPTQQPSDRFDGAFARRLQAAKRDQRAAVPASRPRWGWRLPAFAAAAAGLCAVVVVAVLALRSPPPRTDAPDAGDELELAMNLELLQDYDVVANLEALEDFEVVKRMEELPVEEAVR
jgi:anti-sigma factor RsiW